jgi:hypothetical protein
MLQYRANSKYRNTRVVIDNVTFDSKSEASYYEKTLKPRLLAGEISDLRLQPEYELQPKFRDSSGKAYRAITYRADFAYIENGRQIAEDVKGFRTKDFAIKEKMFRYRYRDIELRLPKAK